MDTKRVKDMKININKCAPLKGSFYIKLREELSSSLKGKRNIHNDNK